MKLLTCLVALSLMGAQASRPAPIETDWAKMRPITPRHYVCCRANGPINIDGRADEPSWAGAPWTEDFVDIEGNAKPSPRLRTRAKMLWDDQYLYVYAELEDPHVWGTITKKNEIIFRDNDFEVFINPDGNNHNYYEYEMNALNTIWELTLKRPYRDGGPVYLGTNLEGLKSAVHVDGTLNDPSDKDHGWSVEIAFPWKGLAKFATKVPCPPKDGEQWRLGFSRVEWQTDVVDGKYQKVPGKPENNWIWSAQGVIDMHRPERWGYVQFSTEAPGSATFRDDSTAPARDVLMDVYYRQNEFKKRAGHYAASLDELEMDAKSQPGMVAHLRMTSDGTGYLASATMRLPDGSDRVLHVRQDSLIWADEKPEHDQEAIEIKEGVAIPRVTRGGRSAIPIDPVAAQIARDQFKAPKDGDMLGLPDGQSAAWRSMKVARDGWFQGGALAGGYLHSSVTLPRDCVMLLEAAGDSMAYVNNVPRAGDPYANGYLRLPVALHAGANDLLFAVGRGRLRARLLPPRCPVMLDTADPTLPDLLTTDHEPLWGAVVVENATDKPLHDLKMHAHFGALDEGELTALPAIPPMTIRKVPFRIGIPQDLKQNTLDLALELLGSGGSVDTASVSLRVRKPSEVYKRTFVSRIDGSVQYYAVNPAQKPSDSNALILTLHGAGVEALGQAMAYGSKDWVTLVAPTNRRPYGFDWEGIGEQDALEVLEIAKKTIPHDPRRVVLAGHSMGGHGTWHVGLTYPDLFAAIGPSAGWSSFTSYVGRRAGSPSSSAPTSMEQILARSRSTSDTLALVRNSLSQEVYILHGSADDNVPVSEGRLMRKALDDIHHPRLSYHEQPGAGHWWGSLCVDWPPMFAMFDEARLPEPGKVNHIEFVTMDPAVSARCNWAVIEQQIEPMKPSRINLSRQGDRVTGTTENVATLRIDLSSLGGPLKELELDDHQVSLPDHALNGSSWVISRRNGKWSAADGIDPAQKNAARGGPFKLAYGHHMILVYGTHEGGKDMHDAFNAARLFAESLYYRGNGAVDLLPDSEFNPSESPDRNVILFGNSDTNSAWKKLLDKSPIQVRNGAVQVGDRTIDGPNLATLFVHPRPGSNSALVASISSTGHAGSCLADALPLLLSGVGYPDWIVAGDDCLTRGPSGVRGAGFFANDWTFDGNESVFTDQDAANRSK